MSDSTRQLGKIESVRLFIEDHGILTLYVFFDFGGSVQGFGGCFLDEESSVSGGRRRGTSAGMDFVLRLLQLFKVDSLDRIVGRTAYALRSSSAWNSIITGIELPEFDGGGKFTIDEWRAEWFDGERKNGGK